MRVKKDGTRFSTEHQSYHSSLVHFSFPICFHQFSLLQIYFGLPPERTIKSFFHIRTFLKKSFVPAFLVICPNHLILFYLPILLSCTSALDLCIFSIRLFQTWNCYSSFLVIAYISMVLWWSPDKLKSWLFLIDLYF